jgi:hypothetical protein
MVRRRPVVPSGSKAAGDGYPARSTRLLFLQRTIGNRAVRRLVVQESPAGLTKKPVGPLPGVGPSAVHLPVGPATQKQPLWCQRRSAVAEYRRQKTGLGRELLTINRITNSSRKRKRRITFVKKILGKVLHHSPFKRIDIQKITGTGTVRAETEWINPAKKNLGIKVTFDERIFKDPLPLIIATIIHESAHADQLKAGMEYYVDPALRVGRIEGIYRKAVNYFAEIDARIVTLYKFVKALPKGHKRRILTEITRLLKKADTAIDRMDSAEYRRRGRKYQKRLVGLFTGNKLKQGGSIKAIWKRDKRHLVLKNDLLPWKRLP